MFGLLAKESHRLRSSVSISGSCWCSCHLRFRPSELMGALVEVDDCEAELVVTGEGTGVESEVEEVDG